MVGKRIERIEDNKKTVSAIVQERIRQAILDGILPGGSRLDQVQLAEDLDVSIVPVREALKKLEGEGFIQIIPRRGAFVTETSAKDMEDLYFTREILEGQAAYHAAEKLTDANLKALETLASQMAQALNKHEFDKFMELNRQFHFNIYQATGSQYLLNMIASHWDLAERYRFQYVMLRDQATTILQEHQEILDACRARNKQALRDAIVHHMRQTLLSLRTLPTEQK